MTYPKGNGYPGMKLNMSEFYMTICEAKVWGNIFLYHIRDLKIKKGKNNQPLQYLRNDQNPNKASYF